MTIQELVAQYEEQKRQLEDEAPYFLAASTTHADMSERIFTDGLNANEAEIGKYNNTNPLYIGALDTPIAQPKAGKYGDTQFKNGKPHKTTYFESYKDFRAKIGRESGFVNLQLFGNLMNEFSAMLKRETPKIWYAEVIRADNVAKANGAESKYGRIFAATDKERATFRDTLRFEINRIINA